MKGINRPEIPAGLKAVKQTLMVHDVRGSIPFLLGVVILCCVAYTKCVRLSRGLNEPHMYALRTYFLIRGCV